MRVLVCFAVPQEAAPFRPPERAGEAVRVRVTGMGRKNAELAIREELEAWKPELVLSCGFAGGLNPALKFGAILFSPENACGFAGELAARGARPGRFHCVEQVASRAEQKRRLRQETGADAVEMESGCIGAICARHQVPCVTIRVVLDTAGEDLPMDFNAVVDDQQQISPVKLALAIAGAPSRIPALIRLRRRSAEAAEKLANVLQAVLMGV